MEISLEVSQMQSPDNEHEPATTDVESFAKPHSVLKQRTKLAYLPPKLVSIPRVSPVGYEAQSPETLEAVSLEAARQARGWSVRQLAKRSGISPSTIYRVELGTTWPRPHVAYALSEALECSPWEVIEFRDVMATISLPR
jgi:lambda repressor-like predicted transcriptional regulator